ncbi:hypothetical protein EVAR_33864_1 [Eumeta japonica]|uniref:Uncharacterized protein n=1 Tax=Eumeta variegata TaxID=151549 RepID=A0A4C1X846_EUMVA|nr:hypothetical protein EVAR_33864_1 [Eumeta japonica]
MGGRRAERGPPTQRHLPVNNLRGVLRVNISRAPNLISSCYRLLASRRVASAPCVDAVWFIGSDRQAHGNANDADVFRHPSGLPRRNGFKYEV